MEAVFLLVRLDMRALERPATGSWHESDRLKTDKNKSSFYTVKDVKVKAVEQRHTRMCVRGVCRIS